MRELTEEQIRRQDLVDNAIYQLIQIVSPDDKNIEWDISMIGDVRDVISEWIVEIMKITDEQTFYSFLDD